MTASDFQINFPYGATSPPYSAAHPHRGDDRPCPEGTPVVISGVTIGLTGHTGLAAGPHLHVQEWQTDYTNTRKPQNAFKPGRVVNIDATGIQGDGSFGKFVTVQTADGWNDSYCHLSQINVNVGQEIGGKTMTQDNLYSLIRAMLRREPTMEEVTNPAYLNNADFAIETFWNNGGEQSYKNPPAPNATVLKPGTYKVN